MFRRSALLKATNSGSSGPPGFGAKYANPATLPTSECNGVSFSPSGNAIAIAIGASPCVAVYQWSRQTGFGTRYANPSTLPMGNGFSVRFSPSGNELLVMSLGVHAYTWSSTTGFGTKYAMPSELEFYNAFDASFSPSGDALVVSTQRAPGFMGFKWSSASGFGTRYANPSTLPFGNSGLFEGGGAAFSPNGNAVALNVYKGNGIEGIAIHAYGWSYSTGFGTKYGNPASFPDGGSFHQRLSFSPAADAIVTTAGANVAAYPWSALTGFGTRFTDPGGLINYGQGVSFSTSGNAVMVRGLNAYRWSVSGFGARYADPATAFSGGSVRDLQFSPDSSAVTFASSSSPFISVYPFNP